MNTEGSNRYLTKLKEKDSAATELIKSKIAERVRKQLVTSYRVDRSFYGLTPTILENIYSLIDGKEESSYNWKVIALSCFDGVYTLHVDEIWCISQANKLLNRDEPYKVEDFFKIPVKIDYLLTRIKHHNNGLLDIRLKDLKRTLSNIEFSPLIYEKLIMPREESQFEAMYQKHKSQ
jgi:hypothetical protein